MKANGSIASAEDLTENTIMTGQRNDSDGYDYYKITAPTGKTSIMFHYPMLQCLWKR